MGKPTVIVINSLVARGSVGGRASVLALERLGFPVVFVPTVVLSWHPGHGRATRLVPDAPTFAALVGDLAGAPWLAGVDAVLTGYLGAADQAEPIAGLVASLKAANPMAIHLCDPNIGDGGSLFQPEPVAAAVRDRLLPLADIATPNRFEADWLAKGSPGRLPPPEIVVTSARIVGGTIETLVETPTGRFSVSHRWLPDNAVRGTGDLFAALYLGHRLDGAAPEGAAARATSAVCSIVIAANRDGLDELPLAANLDLIAAPATGVNVTRLADD